MRVISRRRSPNIVVAVALSWACSPARADDKPAAAPAKQSKSKSKAAEKISGLILKVEKSKAAAGKGAASDAQHLAVTVGTDVVWRDFVRDQAVAPKKAAKESTAKAASKGRKSVAGEGQPVDPELTATAELDGRTKLTIRYREATDEATEGAATPAGAAKAEADADPDARPSKDGASKAPKITAEELKPGLWVEIELRPGDPKHARTLTVMRPVEDVNVPKPASR
jgi:hypothetical protein